MASNDQQLPNDSNLPRGLLSRGGTPAGKGTRLPSIRAPRDLTLGGVKKKTFAPNILQLKKERVKSEPLESAGASHSGTTINDYKKQQNNRGNKQRGTRGGRGKPETIQSHSIFEQGPTEKLIAGRTGSGISYGSGGGDRSGSSATTSRVKVKKEKSEDTKKILDGLLRDDFTDDGDDDDMSGIFDPVKLPLAQSHSALKAENKSETTEHMDIDDQLNNFSISKVMPHVKLKSKDISCKELFTQLPISETGETLFFQLPDRLPGIPPSGADEDKRMKQDIDNTKQSSSNTQDQNDSNSKEQSSLRDFPEGHIGKLQVLKSGKCRLLLGNVALDVSTGTPCGFLQDLVSIKTEDDVGDMKVLGHMNYRLICSPDFESILHMHNT